MSSVGGLLYNPLVYGACLLGEVYSYYICFTLILLGSEGVSEELQLIVLVFYLLQCFLGSAIELKFHNVALLRCLYQQVYAAVRGVVLRM